MEKIYIYGIYNPKNPKNIRYIGKTKKNVKERLKQHIYLSKKKVKRPLYLWINKLLENNINPEIMIIEETDSERWIEREIFWISEYKKNKKLLNLSDGGESNLNYKPSDETKKKISKSNLGKHFYWKGKKLTEEHKKNIGISGLGKKRTEETKKNISKSLLGKKLTEEHKLKLRERSPNKGKIAKNSKKVVKICPTTGNELEIYESIELAAKKNNIKNKGNIVMVCKNFRNKCGGYYWRYKK